MSGRKKTDPDGFLPNFCGLKAVFATVVGGELLAMLLVLGSARTPADMWSALSVVSLFVQWVGLATLAVLCACRRWLAGLSAPVAGTLAWLVALAVTAAVSLVGPLLLPELINQGQETTVGAARVVAHVTITGIVAALVLRFVYLEHRWRTQLAAEADARVQALQARMRPHFLFNSINTVAGLTRENPQLAEELLEDLADLLRASLSKIDKESTLGDEIGLVRGYLHIEKQRLGERLHVRWDLGELPMDARLPPLILQPLVENAIHHGIEPSATPSPLRIVGRYRRGQVNISVRNGMPGGNGATARRGGHRIALENTRERLATLFQGHASLSEGRVEGEFQVRLVFPYPWVEP